jgi:hypothetical protein
MWRINFLNAIILYSISEKRKQKALLGLNRCNGPRRSQLKASAVAAAATAAWAAVTASAGKATLLLLAVASPAAAATSGPAVSRSFVLLCSSQA